MVDFYGNILIDSKVTLVDFYGNIRVDSKMTMVDFMEYSYFVKFWSGIIWLIILCSTLILRVC
jgi:hypothetical protein